MTASRIALYVTTWSASRSRIMWSSSSGEMICGRPLRFWPLPASRASCFLIVYYTVNRDMSSFREISFRLTPAMRMPQITPRSYSESSGLRRFLDSVRVDSLGVGKVPLGIGDVSGVVDILMCWEQRDVGGVRSKKFLAVSKLFTSLASCLTVRQTSSY